MPLKIEIKLVDNQNNEHETIKTLFIGRLTSLHNRHGWEEVHNYLIDDNLSFANGVAFKHTYSDGAEACVQRGLEALCGKPDQIDL